MTADRPLEGKRVVVTRAVEQAKELKDRLEQLGATVLLLPSVSFSAPSDTAPLDRAIGSLESFDWLLFTSANAVRFFADRCRKLGRNYSSGRRPQCGAVGFATASAATAEGLAVDYVAQEFRGEALARELGSSLAGKRVLLPRSDRAGNDLPEALRKAGAEVTEAVAYLTGGVGGVDPEVVQAVREGRVDVISFFSPSAVENVRSLLGADVLQQLEPQVAFAAVGPVTAAALRNAGLRVAIEAEKATAEAAAKAMVKYFASFTEAQARPQ
jgi:uroporphyrinogen III methyltransferase/synthase